MAIDTPSRQPLTSSQLRRVMTPDVWLRLALILAVIVALHVIGWATAVLVIEPAQFSVGGKAFGIDLNAIGFLIAGLFVVTWAVTVLIWCYARIEEKWTVQTECVC